MTLICAWDNLRIRRPVVRILFASGVTNRLFSFSHLPPSSSVQLFRRSSCLQDRRGHIIRFEWIGMIRQKAMCTRVAKSQVLPHFFLVFSVTVKKRNHRFHPTKSLHSIWQNHRFYPEKARILHGRITGFVEHPRQRNQSFCLYTVVSEITVLVRALCMTKSRVSTIRNARNIWNYKDFTEGLSQKSGICFNSL